MAAVSTGKERLDLVVCGFDGHIYSSCWRKGEGWTCLKGAWQLVGSSTFEQGYSVAVLSRGDNFMDVFVCGLDGKVVSARWRNGK